MTRRSEKPASYGCESKTAPLALCGLFRTRSARSHSWRYSSTWNGNNREVLPFLDGHTRGIARSGWRCYHCGKFEWDQSNTDFALSIAHSFGLIELPKKGETT